MRPEVIARLTGQSHFSLPISGPGRGRGGGNKEEERERETLPSLITPRQIIKDLPFFILYPRVASQGHERVLSLSLFSISPLPSPPPCFCGFRFDISVRGQVYIYVWRYIALCWNLLTHFAATVYSWVNTVRSYRGIVQGLSFFPTS